MERFKQRIEQGLEHRLEEGLERIPRPTVAIVTPGTVESYDIGIYQGNRNLMITNFPDLQPTIEELYLQVGEGGMSERQIERIMSRELPYNTSRKILFVGLGYSVEQERELAELSTRYVLPVIIIPFQELIPKQLKIIAGDVREGKSYQQIVEEQIGRTYL